MDLNIGKELATLRRLAVNELRARYAELFGEETSANNRDWLVKRIAWRLQALAEGDLSERARQRAAELANDADLRLSPPPQPQTLPLPAESQRVTLPLRGKMDRPAVKRLLGDIEAGKVDCVVVYKVDRLSRSLLDFAKMMESFDSHQVAFVSVTQQFNTSTSMGRLVLNVLLSFAQFEREIISERTRDKIAAARLD